MPKTYLDPSKFIRVKEFEEINRKKYCELVFFDKELFGHAIEFYNHYFKYKDHPIDEKEALTYAEMGVRINSDLWKSMMPMNQDKMNYFYGITPFYFFHSVLRFMDGIHQEMLHDFAESYQDPILDFAGGSGGASIFLAKKGKDVTFFDGNTVQSAWMHWINKKLNLGIKVLNNAQEIQGKFNFIIAKDIAEHVVDPNGLLQFLTILLNPKGSILFTETDIPGPDEFAPMHFKLHRKENSNDLLFDIDENVKTLERQLHETESSNPS